VPEHGILIGLGQGIVVVVEVIVVVVVDVRIVVVVVEVVDVVVVVVEVIVVVVVDVGVVEVVHARLHPPVPGITSSQLLGAPQADSHKSFLDQVLRAQLSSVQA
jgi:hypothetical protein